MKRGISGSNNPDKASKWAKFARQGHDLAWEFDGPRGTYTGRMLIDGEIYTRPLPKRLEAIDCEQSGQSVVTECLVCAD
jgi:hypothetical protein